jgi:pyridoxal phosphate enzyme (YggS family)
VQEAEAVSAVVAGHARCHFIGHLQKNKAKKAVRLFDMLETLDSLELAREVDKRAAQLGRPLPALIEINSGREPQKFGVLPEEAEELVRQIAPLDHVRIRGVMTMGPYMGDPEDARPYFVETRRVFERLGACEIPGVEMTHLSMGMTNSYRVAIEEGANLVRIGTKIFGPR